MNVESQFLNINGQFNHLYFSNFSWFFTIFSFGLTLVRELIKDMQDIEGDTSIQAKTVPILWGINRSKYFVMALLVIILAVLFAQMKVQMLWSDTYVRQIPLGSIALIFLLVIGLLAFNKLSLVRLKCIDGSIKIAMVVGVILPFYWKWMEVLG
jgi:4-hydroxybenzoate polyprenyltransferase